MSKYFRTIANKDNVKIEWIILHKINNGVPLKPESCSICNLEKLTIAEADKNKALYTINELSTTNCTTNLAF